MKSGTRRGEELQKEEKAFRITTATGINTSYSTLQTRTARIVTGAYCLESFDTPEMKELLSRKCEKREEWKGVCKGVNGLSTMTDRDVVEKASNAKNGDKFKRLYAGEDLQNNHSNSDMSLMNLLAYWCNGDKEQMLRIFATSGLFRPNKSPDYYECTAIKALHSMPVKSTYTPTIPKNTGGNGKR